jgi:hypothetical protein
MKMFETISKTVVFNTWSLVSFISLNLVLSSKLSAKGKIHCRENQRIDPMRVMVDATMKKILRAVIPMGGFVVAIANPGSHFTAVVCYIVLPQSTSRVAVIS